MSCAATLGPVLREVLRAESWQEREAALMAAYRIVEETHNRLEITPPVELEIVQMCGRPFKVRFGDFPGALAAQIEDPEVRRIF